MTGDLNSIRLRATQNFGLATEMRHVPLIAMDSDERLAHKQAVEGALEGSAAVIDAISSGELQVDVPVVEAFHTMNHRMRDLRLVRASEERCLVRPGDTEFLAAEREYREAFAARDALLDQLTGPVFARCGYIGGYEYLPNPIDPAVLWFAPNMEMTYVNAGSNPDLASAADALLIPWAWIDDLMIEDPDEVRRRVTATRAAAFGVLALAMRKRVNQAILELGTTHGSAYFEIDGYKPVELRALMSGWRRYFQLGAWIRSFEPRVGAPAVPDPSHDPLERIRTLAELKDAGLVTQDEFERKRLALLDQV